jgi:hypothetical protein
MDRVKHINKLFICSILFICFHHLAGQEIKQTDAKTELTGGFGIMEVFNIGLDFENDNSQVGLKIGGLAADGETLFSLTADYSYYFAGTSKKFGNRTWFGKAGIQYFSDKSDSFSEKATGFIIRAGRKIYFTEKTGVKIDLGMFFRIMHEEYHENPPWLDWDMPIFPGMGISFFFGI